MKRRSNYKYIKKKKEHKKAVRKIISCIPQFH